MPGRLIVRNVNQRCDINARQTLENEFFDGVPIHRNPARDHRMEIRLDRRQAANHLQKLLSQLLLHFEESCFGADGVPGLFASLVLLPSLFHLIFQVRSDAGPFWKRLFKNLKKLRRGRVCRGQRPECAYSGQQHSEARSNHWAFTVSEPMAYHPSACRPSTARRIAGWPVRGSRIPTRTS